MLHYVRHTVKMIYFYVCTSDKSLLLVVTLWSPSHPTTHMVAGVWSSCRIWPWSPATEYVSLFSFTRWRWRRRRRLVSSLLFHFFHFFTLFHFFNSAFPDSIEFVLISKTESLELNTQPLKLNISKIFFKEFKSGVAAVLYWLIILARVWTHMKSLGTVIVVTSFYCVSVWRRTTESRKKFYESK